MKPLKVYTSPNQSPRSTSPSSRPYSADEHDGIFDAKASPSRLSTPKRSPKRSPGQPQLAFVGPGSTDRKRVVAHSAVGRSNNLSPFRPSEPESTLKGSPATISPAYRVRTIHSAGTIYNGPDRFVDRISVPSRSAMHTAPHIGAYLSLIHI